MPSRKLTYPGSNAGNRAPQTGSHRQFTDVFEDEPPADIPSGTLSKVINAIAVGSKCKPRNGSILWTSTRPPAVDGRTGYAAHTNGQYIDSDSGNIFTPGDVSFLWCWGDGTFDEIVEYISPTRVRRRDSETTSGTACYLQGRPNLWKWHQKQRVFIVQLGYELYIVNYEMTIWTLVVQHCHWRISNSESSMVEDGDYAVVANSRYCWRVIIDNTPPIAYPINSPVTENRLDSNDGEGEKKHRYNYLIALARIDGTTNFRHRLEDPPPLILTESGTTRIDEHRQDWVTEWTDESIGEGSATYGVLTSAGMAGFALATLTAINDATMQISMNGYGVVGLVMDFEACTSLYDCANVIQGALREYWPSATCEYVYEDGFPRIRITSGKTIAGGSVSYAYNGTGGTNVAGILQLRQVDGATITTPYTTAQAEQMYLRVPPEQWVSGQYQWWATHYVVYRTPDLGPTGYHLDVLGERVANSPDEFIWAKDLRICGSFIAKRHRGYVYARLGEFEPADKGTQIEFEDGSRVTIVRYINGSTVQYSTTPYYSDSTDWMAACIGGGRVARVSQAGNVVTVWPGSSLNSFTALNTGDIRKAGWWPDGSRSYIKRRISATQWEVWDYRTRDETGFALDPTYRVWTDIIDDDQLRSHAAGWACRNRFMREVEPSNCVAPQPAFMIFGARGGEEVRYCPLNPDYKPFLGYHNREYQTIELRDKIMSFWGFTTMFSALCQGSIYTASTNNSIEITVPETFQKIWQLAGMEKRADFGIADHGSVSPVGKDLIRFVTSTLEVVEFDGLNYSPDICVDQNSGLKRWTRALEKSLPIFAGICSRVTAHVLWWKKDSRLE